MMMSRKRCISQSYGLQKGRFSPLARRLLPRFSPSHLWPGLHDVNFSILDDPLDVLRHAVERRLDGDARLRDLGERSD